MSTDFLDDPSEDDQALARLNEIGVSLDPEIPYRLSTMFPKLEGWGAKGGIKKKAKIIAQVEPSLKAMLHQGEEVLYIAKGIQHSFAEQYFMGIWAQSINQTVFVLTNVRLLMLRTNGKGKPKQTFWVIYYSQIEKFKGSWTGVLQLKLRDGKKLKFTGFPKLDRKTMPVVFEEALAKYRELGFDPEVTQSLENLCSDCYQPVAKGVYDCDDCGTSYWKPKDVALRSLIFPSWGDLVLKHYTIAVVEMIGFFMAWAISIVLVVDYLNTGEIGAIIAAGFILVMTHGMDALITYYVAGKGLHPRSRQPTHAANV